MQKIKKLLPNLLLLSLSITLSLFVVEIIARKIGHEEFAQNRLYILSDYSVFVYKPDTDAILKRQEFTTDVKINSKGIRDYEYDYEKGKNVKRIEMFGDSFIAAFQVPLEKSISKKLESSLNKNSKSIKYEVLNMGLSGSGPTPQVLLLGKEGIKYNPDMVIFNLYMGNDFVKVDYGISGSMPKEIFQDSSNLENAAFKVTKIQKLKNIIFRNYFTYSYLKNVINNIRYGEANDIAYSEINIYKKQYPENVERNLDKLKIILKHLKRYTDEKRIKLLVVLIPTKAQVDKEKFADLAEQYSLNASELEINKAQKIFLQFGRENNITMIDLLPEFSKRNKNNTFYFEPDGHWNEKGQELAANFIYENLINSRILQKG